MLALILAIIIIAILIFFLIKNKPGYVLGNFLIFSFLLPEFMIEAHLKPFALVIRYTFFLIILFNAINYKKINSISIKKYPIYLFFLSLFLSFFIFNSISKFSDRSEFIEFNNNFVLRAIIPFFLALYLLNNKINLSDFLSSIKIWAVFSILLFFLFTDFNNIDFLDRFTFVEETGFDTINVSRVFGIIFIYSLIKIINKETLPINLINFVASGFFLLVTGQRGTIVGIAIGFIMYLNVVVKNKITRNYAILFLLFNFIFLQFINLKQFEVLNRFAELEDYESTERFADYPIVWQIFQSNNLFFGEGSLSYYFNTGRVYPHNILLEAAVDYGLLGVLSMALMLIYGFFSAIQLIRSEIFNKNFQIVALIWIMLFSSVLVSGSFVSNSIFFVFSAILLGCQIQMKSWKQL